MADESTDEIDVEVPEEDALDWPLDERDRFMDEHDTDDHPPVEVEVLVEADE